MALAVSAGLAVLVLGTLPFGMGWIGGGDVKLVAACACALEWWQILPLFVYTALAGGALGLVVIALRRSGKLRSPAELPYAVAIAAGVGWLTLGSTLVPSIRIL